MTNNAQLLPLPEPDFQCGDCTIGEGGYTDEQMQSYALACIEAAKPADALGSLPVVAYFMKFADGSEEYSRYLPSQADYEDIPHHITKLTDHAQATAELAKRDAVITGLKGRLGEFSDECFSLKAKLAGVDGLIRQARLALESCDHGHISDGGNQWYNETLVEPAIAALATYEAAQGTK